MTPKQIKSLELVRKLHNMELEKEAGRLGELRQREAMLAGEKGRLRKLLQRDNAEQPVETAGYIPLFVKSVNGQTAIIDNHLAETTEHLKTQEEAVRASFSDVKTLDLVIETGRIRIQNTEEKREREEIEEIALMIHKRRQDDPTGVR